MSNDFKVIEISMSKKVQGVVFEKNGEKGANKSVLIIDDDWEAAKRNIEDSKPARAGTKSITVLRHLLLDCKFIRKVAFLTLLEKKENINEWHNLFKKCIAQLNCEKIYVLVDVYYGPISHDSDEVGIYVIQLLDEQKKKYKTAFFSEGTLPERYEGKLLFVKSEIFTYYRATKKLLPSILKWLDEMSEDIDLSSLDVAQWTSLRKKMFDISFEYGKNELSRETPYYDWVHHLPGGGQEADKISQYSQGFEQLKKCNDEVSLESLNLPDYFWVITDRWKYPPLRALGQFDDFGRDLTRFFYHLGECCRKKFGHNIKFNFTYPAGAMEHDYLWFNCAALGEGLITLAEGFSQDFKDKTGDIFWSVNELLDEECGLEIIIRQYVHLQFEENSASEKRNLRGDPLKKEPNGRIPTREKSKGRVNKAYDYFERAGAQHIHIGLQDYKYDLKLFIPAEKSPNGHFWQVKKGA